ncbi:MAG: CehA/McbA family metallohydrolase [Myxococcales bacterium]|nr:CehA/McbA family metallohydrolase [Myxococcales bacterium]
MLALAAVISTLHLTGAVPLDGGAYHLVTFDVPAGTVEFTVAHDDGSDYQILDWGVWSPAGFRGWGGGLTDPAVIGVAGSSRGYLAGPIAAGAWTVVIGKAKLGPDPGQYTLDLEFRDAATVAPEPAAPWTPVVLDPTRRWYAGDFHVHSRDSGDASATLDQIVGYARGRGLDFVVLSDHNTSAQYPHQAAAQAGVTDLLLVRGAEVTTYGGHGNAVGIARYVDHRVGLGGVGAPSIVADVVAQGGLFIVNHPELRLGELCIGCGWDHADTPWAMVSGLEIQTGNADLTGGLFTPRAIARWDQLLDAGNLLAAIGGSDDHRGGTEGGATPALIGGPTTMVLADELSEAAILAAVRAGRTVVKMRGPDDPMAELIAVDPVDAAHRAELGDTLRAVGQVRLEVTAPAAEGATAELWRDGALIEAAPIVGGHAAFTRAVTGARERYRVELSGATGRSTITSHVYVEGDPALADDGGCGCQGGGAGARGAPLLVAALALARRRRRR